ncbi:MAG: ribonuclease E/G, partial [Gammaproteobacteria bacterium]|nr:ribonuclease E/G [Gammaproteobacteria bacterium]
MNEEILINFSPMETRVAVIENGMLQEVHVERNDSRGIVGNVYQGKVVRVLPGMQAAFVDIGLEKAAFIHAGDIEDSAKERPIGSLLREGQSILVQVTKDPIGSKGARLTTQISIASRFLVYMPGASHVGISQRIEDEDERNRIRDIVLDAIDPEGKNADDGFILRTVAEGVLPHGLYEDIAFLRLLWGKLQERAATGKAPSIIY